MIKFIILLEITFVLFAGSVGGAALSLVSERYAKEQIIIKLISKTILELSEVEINGIANQS